MSNNASSPRGRNPWPRWLSRRTGIVCLALGCAVALAVWYGLGYCPGTLQTEASGARMKAWGTGVLTDSYPSGAVKCRHWFTAGTLRKSEWYKPDGTTIAREKAYPDAYSRFLFLRDDGTISSEGFVYDQTLDGPWFDYDEKGNVVRIVRLIGGLTMVYWKDEKWSEKSNPPPEAQQNEPAASP